MNKLIPFVSTHFRWVSRSSDGMTKGRIYRIKKWRESPATPLFSFKDNRGVTIEWHLHAIGLVDCSFEENLKKILE